MPAVSPSDWWWETMPEYLFFLVLGLSAVLFLLMMNRLRAPAFEASVPFGRRLEPWLAAVSATSRK
jgi:hypothetical protein